MSYFKIKIAALAGLAVLAVSPAVKAGEWNQKTVFTFSAPVEVPGQTLPAGIYVFKLADSQSSRHIVQVFNKDENHVLGTFLAIPYYGHRPSSETVVRFAERAAGSPQAIKAWIYPGRAYGHEFVYPKSEALALAKANNVPVLSMPNDLTPDTTKPDLELNGPEVKALELASLKAEKPDGHEVQLAELFASVHAYHPVGPDELPSRLPDTASATPLAGLGFVACMMAVMALRIRKARAVK